MRDEKNKNIRMDEIMPQQLTSQTFNETIKSGVTLVDFSAEWCPPCKMMKPIINKLDEEFAGKAKITEVDVDASPELADQFGVQSIPTLIVFKDGKEVGKTIGLTSKYDLIEKLNAQL